jgi:hypothetical protein
MITSDTPYKLAEIIRDTWPGLYLRPPAPPVQKSQNFKTKELKLYK